MKTTPRNSIVIACIIAISSGCDSGSKPASINPGSKKPGKVIAKHKIPPGESENRTTNKFRNSLIKMDTDLNFLRLQGEWVFATPFNKHDGLGDGPINPKNKVQPGGRLTLPAFPSENGKAAEGNKFFLRVNGLDSQTCVECHFIVNNSTVPAKFGVGGVGGVAATAFPATTRFLPASQGPKSIDAANFNGRVINPPFVFGSGGVELLAKEMTENLHQQLRDASNPPEIGKPVHLKTHGVDFGFVTWKKTGENNSVEEVPDTKTNCDAMDKKNKKMVTLEHFIAISPAAKLYAWTGSSDYGTRVEVKSSEMTAKHKGQSPGLELDTKNLKGVDGDLVIKPFGRKGNNVTTRDFDCGALRFHMGMEPVEIVGKDNDNDGDGVVNEITIAELSALSIFNTTTPRPNQDKYTGPGVKVFNDIGCSGCHVPVMKTERHILPYQQPEQPQHPFDNRNKYYEVDLVNSSANFEVDPDNSDGMLVKLFSDLKRYDMGHRLQESLTSASTEENRTYITARLWGVADTAPYMHDGRATTLTEAIKWHGGDADAARNKFIALSDSKKVDLLNYLRSLHTPTPEELVIN
ncbi:MAG: hypothetical protein L3J75_09265 [Methylococcaceae bacterium]|nr:hypothetical protein [Methylococcaceae bacterium]